MAEDVSTGGLKGFRYGKGFKPKMSDDEKKEIDEAYQKYYERKERERKHKIIWWVIGIIIALVILGFIIWKFVL